MESLQFFIGMKAEMARFKAQSKGFMYVKAQIYGKATATKAMIDTRAMHNIISKKEANQLGLQFAKKTDWVNAVNLDAKPINGAACGVDIYVGNGMAR
ncbi:hypothetical protein AMTR_s00016p00098660 [Amborella trichopoda]|uniref:Uncharacterized protein n=1 Tax=Amborella trichopoda TaxID=13333 RepID=W1PGC1_AMBTC|nr:hypothetical protein AMTR_s00016p00098660 [Amborella trichopoda]